jgi:hypothetical protein
MGEHTKISGTYERLKSYISVPSTQKDIRNVARKGHARQRNKQTVPNTKMGMQIIDTPYATFEKLLGASAFNRKKRPLIVY